MMGFSVVFFLMTASGATAVLSRDRRVSILAVWTAGMFLGGFFLMSGMELLAILQWVGSTLFSVVGMYLSAAFGLIKKAEQRKRIRYQSLVGLILSAIFVGVPSIVFVNRDPQWPTQNRIGELEKIGNEISARNFIGVCVLALSLLIVIILSGVIQRQTLKQRER